MSETNEKEDVKKEDAKKEAEVTAVAAVAEEAAPVDIKKNEDGSITIGDSESLNKPKVERLVGPGVKPDSRYNNQLLGKFINSLMRDGKKTTAEKVMYSALEEIANKLKIDPVNVFEQAIENAKPMVEVKSKRVGGANYQVPIEVSGKRQQALAFRWILEAVRGRRGQPTAVKLAQEIIDCYNKTGGTIQKRENTHRMAEANKAFSHFA
ncbi:MAG: 30S ribosomal protein S7 [Planctomycetes bacterium]|nr:30S ribosomal protein S7 [Planctomycetota bacterium]